ncbi:MAG TPA: SPOR domain-containing protein, partial [Pyrinomonadaceae bacterium]|nr:SPOR domain-containing protein [Pyrinomonadaceae bacterium]
MAYRELPLMLTLPFNFNRLIALTIACALVAQSLVFAQGDTTQQTRPRRVQQEALPAAPVVQPARSDFAVKRLDAEPHIRIGLSTSARSVTISTSAQALNVWHTQPGETSTAPAALAVSRVRIEPRMLMPLPAPREDAGALFRVEIAAVVSEAQAGSIAREVRELTGEAPEIVRDAGAGATATTWRVRVGLPTARAEAEELRTKLEEAGIATVSIVSPQTHPSMTPQQADAARARQSSTDTASARRAANTSPPQKTGSGIRLASRVSLPTRGLVVYAGGTSPLLDSRAPVTFAPAEANAPLRFNEKPYRGRLEVF